MATKKITIERFSITSTKPFAEVVSAIAAQVGHPDITQFYSSVHTAADDEEIQRLVDSAVGPIDLMEFMRFRSRCRPSSGAWPRGPKRRAPLDWQPTDHEKNGEACSRRRLLRAGHDPH